MENIENKTLKIKNPFISIMITQSVCVMLILISLVSIKYFFENTYNDLKKFYNSEICSDTDIDEVIETMGEKV